MKTKTIGRFTAHAGKALKDADSIYCQVSDDGRIYVGTCSLIFCMNSEEYAAAVQPVTHCDAGNWTINKNGRTDKPALDAQRLFNQAAQKATSAPLLDTCPICFKAGKPGLFFAAYFSIKGNFAAAYNPAYIAAVAPGAEIHAGGPLDPAISFLAGEPVALILPVRLKPEQTRAIEAYFTKPTDAERAAEKLQNELSACKQRLDTAHAAIDDLREKNDALAADLAAAQAAAQTTEQPAEVQPEPATEAATQAETPAALKEAERTACAAFLAVPETDREAQAATLAAWRETRKALAAAQATEAEPIPQPEATPAPAAQPEPVEQPAEIAPQTAAERIAARWAQMPGLTATIKGAQTGAPVVWIAGDTKRHARTIKAEGGRWSCKRSAYYFRVA
jgi:hypothetical protein